MKYSIDLERMVTMPNILPVSDLRNYNEVLKNCQVEKKLLEKLQEAEAAVKDEKGWLSLDELKTMVGE